MGSLQYVKGVPFVNGRYKKVVPCLSKMVYKMECKGLDLGGSLPL